MDNSDFSAEQAPAPSSAPVEPLDRRQIMRRFGRYAAVTAPVLMVLLEGRVAEAENPGTDPSGPPGGGFSA